MEDIRKRKLVIGNYKPCYWQDTVQQTGNPVSRTPTGGHGNQSETCMKIYSKNCFKTVTHGSSKIQTLSWQMYMSLAVFGAGQELCRGVFWVYSVSGQMNRNGRIHSWSFLKLRIICSFLKGYSTLLQLLYFQMVENFNNLSIK